MKVKELIKYLKTLPQNNKVVIQDHLEQGQRELFMVENDCKGESPRAVLHPGKRAKKNHLGY